MKNRRINLLVSLVACIAASCNTVERPAADQLGPRVRVRIAGRVVDSVTSADHFLFLTVHTPDGDRVPVRVRASESSGSEGLALSIASRIEQVCELPDLRILESEKATDLCEDFLLPPGYSLDFGEARHFVYRIDDDIMRADLDPEIRIGCMLANEPRYVELPPTAGPELEIPERPPGFER